MSKPQQLKDMDEALDELRILLAEVTSLSSKAWGKELEKWSKKWLLSEALHPILRVSLVSLLESLLSDKASDELRPLMRSAERMAREGGAREPS